MVKKYLAGIMTVVSLTTIACGCLNRNTTNAETIPSESIVITPMPILTQVPTPTPIPTPVPVKMDGEDIGRELSEAHRYYVTFYCSCQICCGPNARGICADGTPVSDSASDHSAAADASIPFGTQFVIPELSGDIYTVHDRGSGVHGNHFDLYQGSHDEALNSPCGYYTVYFID
jgi:3D (Asp-Asp-Asp) domain-containing protein